MHSAAARAHASITAAVTHAAGATSGWLQQQQQSDLCLVEFQEVQRTLIPTGLQACQILTACMLLVDSADGILSAGWMLAG